MHPIWSIWIPLLAIAAVLLMVLYVRREVRRHPIAPKEAITEVGQVPEEPRFRGHLHSSLVPTPGTQLAVPRPRKSTRMKIYLVTVADQTTINALDAAIETDAPIFIGDQLNHGTVAEIQEYVNVDSP